ncbi:MAG: hypothetical protein ABR550_11940, partial [Wenzhouxiangellaceae bacterium]
IAAALIAAGAVDGARVVSVESMADAVLQADRLAPAGACILLSPGAPSFPQYRDFEQRGQRFVDAVASIKGTIGPSSCD